MKKSLLLVFFPVFLFGQTDSTISAFVQRFHKVAEYEHGKFNIPASISLALGLMASECGTSQELLLANNIFQVQCHSTKCHDGHCIFIDGKRFIKFQTCWLSYRDFSKRYSSGKYVGLKEYSKDYRKFAYGLKSLGYSSDKHFAEQLIGTIERYELFKYDK